MLEQVLVGVDHQQVVAVVVEVLHWVVGDRQLMEAVVVEEAAHLQA